MMHFSTYAHINISFKIIYLVFLQFTIFCGDGNFANALIGKKIRMAGNGEFPFVVSVVTMVDTKHVEEAHRCTAALITKQDVLTAEHCVDNLALSGFLLMVGSNNLRNAKPYFSAWWVSYNVWARRKPGHRKHKVNDIAIIKLNKNVEDTIPFAPFANLTYEAVVGLDVSVVGWGHVGKGGSVKKLRTGTVRLIAKEVCQTRMRQLGNNENYNVDERRLCTATDPYILVREGDSGGPLIYDGGIIGVTHGSGPTLKNDAIHPSQVNFHFSTYYYREFLFEVMIENDNGFIEAMVGRNVKKAKENEYPFVISIATIYNDDRPIEETHRCTATLVGRQDAITAQHCLANIEATAWQMLIGSYDLTRTQRYYCAWWWSYEHWASQHNIEPQFIRNDVAYIKIYGNLPESMTVFASVSPFQNDYLYGKKVMTAGWGLRENGKTTKKMQKARLKVITNQDCGQRLTQLAGYRLSVHERRLCTIANPYILIQSGDSGGPLLLNNSIVAVNSGTCPQVENRTWHPDQANLHFGISYYRNFILDVMYNTQTHFIVP